MKPFPIISALFLACVSLPSFGQADCRFEIQAGDSLAFDRNEILIPSHCKTATIALHHTGRLPIAASGHNWVLTTQADVDRVARDGFRAGSQNGWVQPNDPRIIHQTPIIGRGETAEVTLNVSALDPDQTYGFVCTVAGHSPRMRGTLKIVPATKRETSSTTVTASP